MAPLVLPSVGIVIVNHNAQAFVAEAIASAARQTFGRFEAVVVDDASTDESDRVIRETLDRMKDPRFQYVPLKANVGQTGAARQGLAKLKTPFVCFLDSDDVWYEDFLERHLAVHLNCDFPVSLTYCNAHFIDGSGQLVAGSAWWFGRGFKNEVSRPIETAALPKIDAAAGQAEYKPRQRLTLYEDWSPEWSSNSTTSMMFRRSVVDLVLSVPDDDLRLYLDFYLSTFSVMMSSAIAIDDALYAYRMHGANSHSNATYLGGTGPTSRKAWEPIRDRVMSLIHRELRNRRDVLIEAVGEWRYRSALQHVEGAMTVRTAPGQGSAFSRLLRSLLGR
jgi:glycosyltransferase involved in cell wall biosynthesis